MISQCILFCIFNGCRYNLYTQHMLCLLSQIEGNGPGSAVGVNHRFLPGELRKFQRFAVEHFCLFLVHLEEGIGRHFKLERSDGCFQRIASIKLPYGFPENHIALPVLHIVINGYHKRQRFGHFLYPRFLTGQVTCGGNQHHHKFSVIANPAHNMTKASFPSLLVVTGNGVLAYKFSGKTEQLVVFFLLYVAERRRHNVMRPLAIIPQGRNPFHKSGRNGHLVTVPKRMRCRNHRFHQCAIFPGNALNDIHHTPMLYFQLRLV